MSNTLSDEKPQNGIKGLKHWRYDLLAGMQVALVSLPLSLGIAIASGAPPITGVISAIIAGLIFPFLGGAYVTISGPAAGLAPALLSGMLLLGGGDLAAGYPLVLVAICLTGAVQIVLSLFNTGRYAAFFLPTTVVEAMLAAIGAIIIIKQLPALMGVLAAPTKSMLTSMANLPAVVAQLDPAIFVIGAVCLFLMFYINQTRHAWLRRVPAPLCVTAVGIVLAYVLQLDAIYLIQMPENILEGGITLPAFDEVFSRPELWGSILLVVITLTLIDGVESIATIAAVDKIDPYQRKSHPNVTLRAMGISNALSSIFGGLTIIPGGIKSRVNIDAGGRTLWANFYNAMFLVLFLFLAKDLISLVPLAAIAAILIYVGWRLSEVRVFRRTFNIGRERILIFVITIIAILSTDLLVGILIGVLAEVLLLLYLLTPSLRVVLTGRQTIRQAFKLLWSNFSSMLRNPIINVKVEERAGQSHYQISLASVVCFNLLPLDRLLTSLPAKAGITLVVTESGRIIDHAAMEYIHRFQAESVHEGRAFEVQGMENYQAFTDHSLASRMHDAKLVRTKVRISARSELMASVAKQYGFSFSATRVDTLNIHDFVYLRRGDDRHECNVMTGSYRGFAIKLYDYSHTAAPDYYSEHRHTIIKLSRESGEGDKWPNLAITPGSYLERYLVEYREVDLASQPALAHHYRLYAREPEQALTLVRAGLAQFLLAQPGFYIEIHNNVLLAFRPEQGLEPPEAIERLLGFADAMADQAGMTKLEAIP